VERVQEQVVRLVEVVEFDAEQRDE
jgi:hypothetical protein